MLVIGLTGGIGSGKSTVADLFARLGAPIIDADLISRELTQPGQAAYLEIVRCFGHDITDSEGKLDRNQLRTLVFADPDRRRQLESILHPRVYRRIHEQLHDLDSRYCIVVIPLLVETGGNPLVDRILVVDAPEALQRQRAARRDQTSAAEIDAILACQASREQRLQAADDTITNDTDLDALEQAVLSLHESYLQLAKQDAHGKNIAPEADVIQNNSNNREN